MDTTRESILNMCKQHFNELVLCGTELGRLIGFAEDDDDYYLVVLFPSIENKKQIWISACTPYVFLDCLKQQTYDDNDFTQYDYLNRLLILNNAAPEEKFVELYQKTQ